VQLIGGQLLGFPAEPVAIEHVDEMTELGFTPQRCDQQSLQRRYVVRDIFELGTHYRTAPKYPAFATGYSRVYALFLPLLRQLRPRHPGRMHAAPIEPLDERRGLRRGELHHSIANARPAELTLLKTLGHEDETCTIPQQQLEPVSPFAAEDKQYSREGIEPKFVL